MRIGIAITRRGGRTGVAVGGHPLALLLVPLALAWLVVEVFVACDFLRDHHAAYAGRVVAVRTTWVDRLTTEFTPVEHLVIETADGRREDRLVTKENRILFQIAPGDQVVKEQGFGKYPRVPGKPTASERLEELRPRG